MRYLVQIEGIDGDIHLPNPLVALDELMRAAAAMCIEIKDQHGAGVRVERRTGCEDKTISPTAVMVLAAPARFSAKKKQ